MSSRKYENDDAAASAAGRGDALTKPLTLEELVRWRRDVRRFRKDPVPAALIDRILRLADLAPSVGNSQPWRVVSVNDPEKRSAVAANFEAARQHSSEPYSGDRADLYGRLKLAGFDAAPVHLAIFCDRGTTQGHGLGRQTMPETLDHSCACMVTLLWLAAREVGLGLGWVSIVDPEPLRATLDVSPDWKLVGYLLVGWPEEEHLDPELERHRWQARTPFETRYFELGKSRADSAGQPKSEPQDHGSITLVGAGPGDPELLTVKAVRALQAADAVLYDDLVARPILDYVRPGAELIHVGKRGYRRSCKQPEINARMIGLVRKGLRVVRLKSGDPLIFSRAGEEIAACREAGVAFSIVPGVTTAQAAAASLKVALTNREHARRLQLITAHDRNGRLPPDIDWSAVADRAATTVIYMPKRTLGELTDIAIRHGLDPQTPAIAIANATRADELAIVSSVGAIAAVLGEAHPDGPVLVMIGEALRYATTEDAAKQATAIASALDAELI